MQSSEQLLVEIASAFPGASDALSDAYIEANQDLAALDLDAKLLIVVPAYMAWCVRNAHRPHVLVHDYTVQALCEFGKVKSTSIPYLSFKFQCSSGQRAAVISFLRWCLNPELLHHVEQIERSLRHWSVDETS